MLSKTKQKTKICFKTKKNNLPLIVVKEKWEERKLKQERITKEK